ncbi:MAG: S8 family serine peptidase [Pseudobdellovibrio sp.]|nr:S8 family serine peptidase [Pseudobdellovibrio sp.]
MNAKFITGGALSKTQKGAAFSMIFTRTLFVSASFLAVCFLTTSSAKAVTDNVVVAVIDTGVDINHKDLKNSIWVNAGETGKDVLGRDKATNGIDDDLNGYVDDVNGWNFVDNNNKVFDNEGHGTHVAGIIHKEYAQKKHGEASLRLMVLKYYNPKGSDKINVMNTINALQYASRMKAQIINYSAGGAMPEYHELQAIQDARKQGIVMVVAAGNEQEDTDVIRYYPASYKLDNMISVAAIQKDGGLTTFSNYGKNTVDLAAPGKSIFSTLPKNRYGILSGTSQATAFVTGHLAAVMGERKPASYKLAIDGLFKQAVYNPALKGRTKFQVALLNEMP